ncbi:MAG TPA: tetratricopeptide repeat protein [Candidatus Acidoferrum sp.]|nr:tetratricopeptide repeat protein [Candidatus Acidoferrum sp.]
MSDSATAPGQMSEPPANEARLESWGEIASYLRRDVRTVQRWERYHGLPVRRLQVGKLATVYAYRSELDKWFLERQPKPENDDPQVDSPPDASDDNEDSSGVSFLKSFGLRNGLLAGLILLVLGGGIYFLLVNKSHLPGRMPDKTRLFVRPFANHSGDSKQDEFTEGLTDEINTQLGRLAPLRLGVIAPTSSKILASKSIDELRRDLNVQYVLEGSVRRGLNQVRIDVTLISASDQTPVWADSFTNDLNDILQAQDEVAAAVAKKILVTIPSPFAEAANAASRVTSKQIDPEAYEAYLAGRRFWANRDLRRSIDAYQKALEKNPDYVPARSGLASAYLILGEAPNDGMPPAESAPRAREEARRALSSDPANVEAHCVLANIALSYDWDYAAAERGYKRALSLEPNNPTAHQWYAEYLIVRNRIPEAQEEAKVALDLDPVSPIFYTARAEAFYYARDFDAALSQAQRTLEQYPNFLVARLWLGFAYREKKLYAHAIEQFDLARQQTGNNPAMLMAYGHALAVSGDKAEARKVLSELAHLAKSRYVPAIYFASIYAGLGEKDQAFAWLDKSFRERNDRLVYLAVEPIADPLRSDPRFRDLMNRLHLP